MKKLSREQEAQRDKVCDKVLNAEEACALVIQRFNDEQRARWLEVVDALNALNESIEEHNDFIDEVSSLMDEFFTDKSEKWQESEKGQEYQEWKESWEGSKLEEVEISEPEELEAPEVESEALRELPSEP
jgi:hypothetical protein